MIINVSMDRNDLYQKFSFMLRSNWIAKHPFTLKNSGIHSIIIIIKWLCYVYLKVHANKHKFYGSLVTQIRKKETCPKRNKDLKKMLNVVLVSMETKDKKGCKISSLSQKKQRLKKDVKFRPCLNGNKD